MRTYYMMELISFCSLRNGSSWYFVTNVVC